MKYTEEEIISHTKNGYLRSNQIVSIEMIKQLLEENRKLLTEREQILGLGFKDFDKNTLALTIEWYINRLVVVHGEHQNADFIVKGREIVDMLLNIEMAPRHQPPTSE